MSDASATISRKEKTPLGTVRRAFLRRNGWRRWHLPVAIGLGAFAVLASFDAWADVFRHAWKDEESSHILLVPVIAAWLVWVRRERMRYILPRQQWVGIALILFGWGLNFFGEWFLVETFWYGGAVIMAVGAVTCVVGYRAVRAFLPAVFVLGFLVPVPGLVRQQISIPLQSVTAKLTHGALEFVGVVSTRSGNVLSVNDVDVAIAEACNGLRMVFALVLVCYAFAFGAPLKSWVRATVLILSPVAAIACNVIRLVPTAWVYGHYGVETGDTFHDISGWVMLPIAFLGLYAVIRTLRWALVPVARYTLPYHAG